MRVEHESIEGQGAKKLKCVALSLDVKWKVLPGMPHSSDMTTKQFAKRVAVACLIGAAAALLVFRFDDVLSILSAAWSVLSPFLYGMMLAYVLNLIMSLWEKLWDRLFSRPSGGSVAASARGIAGGAGGADASASAHSPADPVDSAHSPAGPADSAASTASPSVPLSRRIVGSLRRPVCLMLALATVAAIVATVVMLLSGEFKVAFAALGEGARVAYQALNEVASGDPTLGGLVPAVDFDSLWDTAHEALQSVGGASGVASLAARWGGNIVHGVLDAVIAVVFALYVLAGREHFSQGAQSLGHMVLPQRWYELVAHACSVANENFTRFMGGQCLEACILGTLCAIGGTILGFPYAGSIGLCVGVTSIVPFIGAWLGGILGALMIASVSIEQALMFVVFLVILQQIEGHLIYPNVVGTTVGMPGIWTFFAVVVGGSLFGLFGVLFGVPVVSTIRQLVLEWRATLPDSRLVFVGGSAGSESDARDIGVADDEEACDAGGGEGREAD